MATGINPSAVFWSGVLSWKGGLQSAVDRGIVVTRENLPGFNDTYASLLDELAKQRATPAILLARLSEAAIRLNQDILAGNVPAAQEILKEIAHDLNGCRGGLYKRSVVDLRHRAGGGLLFASTEQAVAALKAQMRDSRPAKITTSAEVLQAIKDGNIGQDWIYYLKLEELPFSNRVLRSLYPLSPTVEYIGQLVQFSEPELLRHGENLGRVRLAEVRRVLGEFGLSLGMRCGFDVNEAKVKRQELFGTVMETVAEIKKGESNRLAMECDSAVRAAGLKIAGVSNVDPRLLYARVEGLFPSHISERLTSKNVRYLAELVSKTETDLRRPKLRFSRKEVKEIKEILGELDLRLGMTVKGFRRKDAEKFHPVASVIMKRLKDLRVEDTDLQEEAAQGLNLALRHGSIERK